MAAPNEVMQSLKWLYETGRYSDLTIKCRTTTFKVHKAVLCPRSRFFKYMCENEKLNELDLTSRFHPVAVRVLVFYMYHTSYPYISPDGDVSEEYKFTLGSRLTHHYRTLHIASFCEIVGLEKLALKEFEKQIEFDWDDLEFIEVTGMVYNSVLTRKQPVREILVRMMMDHKDLLEKEEINALVVAHDHDLLHELLLELQKRNPWAPLVICRFK
ncbi:hypothetical protein B0T11DRAFT_328514 [Plectosphaerella cucumerina]|uniref:BTB domain-containing protein n=1 Tax=Plectosphaerella cucumerina TaxID=40658 RepID=A0A8K0X392_9PEZI|nr:hypothetical protein B0T11DRAFT_328514 [Plectosphaerella cucumerina]